MCKVILISPESLGADREAVRLALEKENIESRPVWKPMHLQPVFDTRLGDDRHEDAGREKGCKRLNVCRVAGGQVAEDFF